MPLTFSYRLRPEVEVHQGAEGLWLLCPYSGNMAGWKSNRPLPLVQALSRGWLDQEEMAARFGSSPASADRPLFQLFFLRLLSARLLDLSLREDGCHCFTVSPAPDEDALRRTEPPAGAGLRLNRFAYLRAHGGGLLLESPLTPHRVLLSHAPLLTPLLALVQALASGGGVRPQGQAQAALLALMLNLGLAEEGHPQEDTDDPMAYWEFHDLLFHARTLGGRHFYPLGGTYRFQGRLPAPPAVVAADLQRSLELPLPSAELAARLEAPLARVLEERRSRREFDPRPMTLDELGAFLYATARVRAILPDPRRDDEVSLRPHAGGGARHALEIYPLVKACQGLEAGAYRYDPSRHALERVPAEPALLERLLAHNPHQSEGPHPPQVSLYVAARLGRAAWKYQSIAYKIINQDLGCLYQTFYLAATALGLAPCAIGSLDAPLVGRALGVDWRREPLVGLFTLGRPAQRPGESARNASC
jgi:SagB-type dehydrogenase family enzyme